jgi:hypothetical protein
MIPINILVQDAIQVLSNPAWAGIGVIVSTTLGIIALHKASEPQSPSLPRLALKKILQRSNSFSNFPLTFGEIYGM